MIEKIVRKNIRERAVLIGAITRQQPEYKITE
jgi:hypothetical protein